MAPMSFIRPTFSHMDLRPMTPAPAPLPSSSPMASSDGGFGAPALAMLASPLSEGAPMALITCSSGERIGSNGVLSNFTFPDSTSETRANPAGSLVFCGSTRTNPAGNAITTPNQNYLTILPLASFHVTPPSVEVIVSFLSFTAVITVDWVPTGSPFTPAFK